MEKLPQEVLENIMRRLTPYDIIRLGLSWKSLGAVLTSRALSIPCSRVASFLSVTLDFSLRCWVHDAACNVWLDVPLDFLKKFIPREDGVLACEGGLLCLGTTMMTYGFTVVEDDVFYDSESNESEFFICNPVTRSWAAIPAIPEGSRQVIPDMSDAVGLCCKGASDGYELFVLTHYTLVSPCYAKMASYSSSERTWRGFPYFFVDDGCILESHNIVCCDSVSYSLWRNCGDLTIFEHDSDGAEEIELPFEESADVRAFLMEFEYVLHMVVVKYADEKMSGPFRDVSIWKLLEDDAWRRIGSMPLDCIREALARFGRGRGLECVGKKGTLYMRGRNHDGWSDVLRYDIAKRQWSWIKRPKRFSDARGFVYEPSFRSCK